ncbi:helicase-related protein [Oceanobacillus sp. J11TS1]|uniref:helicase-related protein n=1 Tax=Oceanobacillus sp. J11TS1 TaxID=2807191 RepID=UPI001B161146|nr:helicase-related protein [Oceanobacillus sp. J11TS1]GIO22723.1 RNA helicase [Oceanobacillus sp. J11TS1]
MFILKRGIDVFLQEIVIPAAYHRAFENGIPDHPKDEYPETRLMKRRIIIHSGPTNSGKTYQSIQSLIKAEKGVYLAPLRLLALEIFEKLHDAGVNCDLITGEEEALVPFATHLSSTIEKANFMEIYDVAVIDEAQLIGDKQRGNAWYRAILGLKAKELHICCSLYAVELNEKIIKECKDQVEIHHHERSTPLKIQNTKVDFPVDIQKGDAIIAFSRKKVLRLAAHLKKAGFKPAVIYGTLPPVTRRKQVELFNDGEADIVVSTDAIGMGLNLPIQRVVFTELKKYDGTVVRELTSQEVKQIAGRAGRKGIFNIGYVASLTAKGCQIIERKLKQRDIPVKTAIIEPLEETIAQIQYGQLVDKLRHWNDFTYKLDYLEKANIDQRINLLTSLPKKLVASTPESDLYRAIHIPFKAHKMNLVNQWERYILEVIKKNPELEKPEIELSKRCSLELLEEKYQLLDLYYSFSKVFQKRLDQDWLIENRENVSNLILQYLVGKNLDIFIKCQACGEEKILYFEEGDYCSSCKFEKAPFLFS